MKIRTAMFHKSLIESFSFKYAIIFDTQPNSGQSADFKKSSRIENKRSISLWEWHGSKRAQIISSKMRRCTSVA
eukprot:3837672-Pleurochrysis_carterae.AAC.1